MKKVIDFDLSKKISEEKEFYTMGFQATHLAQAIEVIEEMKKSNAVVFFSFTANMMATGLRGIFVEFAKKKLMNAVITTAGSIDHDVIRSYAQYYLGSFDSNDCELHKKGINRLGNIFIPTKHFELFEKKVQPWFKEISEREKIIAPTQLTEFIGEKLPSTSFLHWCSKNNIPVFCPGITDGAIGLQVFFFKQDNPGFGIDVTKDMSKLATLVLSAKKTGGIILGGGISKHHVIGINIVRGGLDYAVYVTTSQEWDGSLSGARTHEAKSWGKIREKAREASVFGDATIILPIIARALKKKKII